MDQLAVILHIAFYLAVLVAQTCSNSLWARKYLNKEIYQTNCDFEHTFRCTSGTCINRFHLCDASVHCPDRSDESAAECKHVNPKCGKIANSFRCDYGACIDGKKKCNGQEDCPDGSDEKTSTCDTTIISVQRLRSNCSDGNKECKSGECIDEFSFCDGVVDCQDGSDETPENCKYITCPPSAFKCTYGGCVDESARCDRNKDCIDNSDEADCNNPVDRTQNIPAGLGCLLPHLPEFGNYSDAKCMYAATPCMLDPGRTYFPETAWFLFKCNNGYYMNNMSEGNKLRIYCIKGIWKPQLPVCKKMCSPLISSGVEVTCRYQTDDDVNCKEPMKPGTQATFHCKEMYHQIRPSNSLKPMACNKNGEWNSKLIDCQPVCGRTKNISAEFPWYVTILHRNKLKEWKPICSGSLLLHNIILSAAKCLMANKRTLPLDVLDIKVTFGNYSSGSNNSVYAVGKILIHPLFRGQTTRNAYDIALLYLDLSGTEINPNILPVCIDCKQTHKLKTGTPGMLFSSSRDVPMNDEALYVDSVTCSKGLPPSKKSYATTGLFCAILRNSRKITSRDIGRSLLVRQKGLLYVYGIYIISTYGIYNTTNGTYGIFSDVHNSKVCNWLNENMKQKILLN